MHAGGKRRPLDWSWFLVSGAPCSRYALKVTARWWRSSRSRPVSGCFMRSPGTHYSIRVEHIRPLLTSPWWYNPTSTAFLVFFMWCDQKPPKNVDCGQRAIKGKAKPTNFFARAWNSFMRGKKSSHLQRLAINHDCILFGAKNQHIDKIGRQLSYLMYHTLTYFFD